VSFTENLKYILIKRVLEEISQKSIRPSSYRVSVKGFGDAKSLNLTSSGCIQINLRRCFIPNFSMVSVSELQKNCQSLFFSQVAFSPLIRFRRHLSLALQSGKLLSSIKGSFSGKAYISSEQFLGVPELSLIDGSPLWISRLSSRSGVYNPNLKPSLEYDFRRNTNLFKIFVSEIEFVPSANIFFSIFRIFSFGKIADLLAKKSDLDSAIILSQLMPRWHYVNSFFTLHFDQDVFGAENIYELSSLENPDRWHLPYAVEQSNGELGPKLSDSTSDFIVLRFNHEFILFTDTILIDGKVFGPEIHSTNDRLNDFSWPNLTWTNHRSKFVAIPNFLEEERLGESSIVMGNSSWGHFMEEELPRFVKLNKIRESGSLPIITNDYGFIQSSFISVITRDDPMTLRSDHRYIVEGGYIVIMKNFRRKASKGEEKFVSEETISLLRQVRELILDQAPNIEPSQMLYIAREPGLFRKLANRNKLEEVLDEFGFVKVYTSNLSFSQRLELFGSAKIVVGESGSGLFNLYFVKQGCGLLEIRHPDFELSRESEIMVETVGITHRIFHGKKLSKLILTKPLRDSYEIDLNQFQLFLTKLIQEKAGEK
jgi:capsular polysaccharide biosynthesis protein